jgi:ankyrin repeat protein
MKTLSWFVFFSLAAGCATLPKVDRDLFAAVKADDSSEAARLLAAGANINARSTDDGTPLHKAMERLALAPLTSPPSELEVANAVSTVELLLRRGAEVGARDGGGLSPIHLAAATGQG